VAAATGSSKRAKDPKTCQTHTLKVQFASAQSVRKAGVRLGAVVERPMTATLSASAEVDYDRTRYATIASPLPGRVWRVEKKVGESVKQGEVLALVDSAEVGRAKAEYLSAVASVELKGKTVKRLKDLAEQGMLKSQGELQEAEAASKEAGIRLFNAQQALVNLGLTAGRGGAGDGAAATDPVEGRNVRAVQFLGLPESLAASLDPRTTPATLLPLVAPFDGVVVSAAVVSGQVVSPERERPLFEVADTRGMWVTVDLPLADARRVKLGQELTFRPDDAPDASAAGAISWVSTAVDEQTRTVRVRADVENPDGRLLAHTFGTAQVRIREAPKAVAVPGEAIQWEGCCHVVFVRLADDIFQTRKVKLGAKANGYTEVMIGLVPGEVVATAGSHVLKSEILKSALGAGCCVEE
jgi:cobalt-zinc-cadmium efflux system membrane fusion protein